MRSAAFWQRKGENSPGISLSRSASHFPRPPHDFSTRREKNLRNFPAPLFACKSILHFARCENNILPSVLKKGFLQRSLIKISAFENSHLHLSSLSRSCRPLSAALIPHTTHRRTRAFSLAPIPPHHPYSPDSRAIYEKNNFSPPTHVACVLCCLRHDKGWRSSACGGLWTRCNMTSPR